MYKNSIKLRYRERNFLTQMQADELAPKHEWSLHLRCIHEVNIRDFVQWNRQWE